MSDNLSSVYQSHDEINVNFGKKYKGKPVYVVILYLRKNIKYI